MALPGEAVSRLTLVCATLGSMQQIADNKIKMRKLFISHRKFTQNHRIKQQN